MNPHPLKAVVDAVEAAVAPVAVETVVTAQVADVPAVGVDPVAAETVATATEVPVVPRTETAEAVVAVGRNEVTNRSSLMMQNWPKASACLSFILMAMVFCVSLATTTREKEATRSCLER